jgi:hypothetical protein
MPEHDVGLHALGGVRAATPQPAVLACGAELAGRLLLETDELDGAACLLQRAGLTRHEDPVLRHRSRGDHVGDHEDA